MDGFLPSWNTFTRLTMAQGTLTIMYSCKVCHEREFRLSFVSWLSYIRHVEFVVEDWSSRYTLYMYVGAVLNKTVGGRNCHQQTLSFHSRLYSCQWSFSACFDDSWEVTLSSPFPSIHSVLEILAQTLFSSHFLVITWPKRTNPKLGFQLK